MFDKKIVKINHVCSEDTKSFTKPSASDADRKGGMIDGSKEKS